MAATEEDFHDLPFLGQSTSSIDGMDVRICRIGMAGGKLVGASALNVMAPWPSSRTKP